MAWVVSSKLFQFMRATHTFVLILVIVAIIARGGWGSSITYSPKHHYLPNLEVSGQILEGPLRFGFYLGILVLWLGKE